MSPDDPPRRGGRALDDRLVIELAAGRSIPDAARVVGCSEKTVDRRLASPAFRARVEQARRESFDAAAARLAAVATAAVAALAHLMHSADTDAARVSAARAVLTLALPWRGAVDVEAQLAELREQVAQINAGPTVRRLR